MDQVFTDYYRCPPDALNFEVAGQLSEDAGYFRFGADMVCYGHSSRGSRSPSPEGDLYDVRKDVRADASGVRLPFSPADVVRNLRHECYTRLPVPPHKRRAEALVRGAYYLARPLMPVSVRRHLQRIRLNGWRQMAFPKWPVDTTVDTLLHRLLALSLQSSGAKEIPFIWFWPEGKSACAIMTHDVEARAGVSLCPRLVDLNELFGIPASFQIVPEQRYPVTERFLNSLRDRGFEVNIHDLNHDGRLFSDWQEFQRRAAKINRYAQEYGAVGFRAGVLYRNQDWYPLLHFEYDMSVPNVAHLDPQRGGCCTVMPYLVGDMVELPVTMTQDYSLFHILNEYSANLWRQQIGLIVEKHGLVSVIVHPDYIKGPREEQVYKELLSLYAQLRREQNIWVALPGEVNTWWRQRSRMQLAHDGGEWQIEGEGNESASLAFASLEGDQLTFRVAGRRMD